MNIFYDTVGNAESRHRLDCVIGIRITILDKRKSQSVTKSDYQVLDIFTKLHIYTHIEHTQIRKPLARLLQTF